MDPVVDLDALLQPIPGDRPAGEDMSFADEFDIIKEARRSDDDGLAQGDWVTDLKSAEWPKVKRMTLDVLSNRSKDLQFAAWLAESLVELHALPGLHDGLKLTIGLLETFWDSVYPSTEDGLGPRAGRIGWMAGVLAQRLATVPLCGRDEGNYGLRHWREAREVENLARRDAEKARALVDEENKTTSETLARAVGATAIPFYAALYADATACIAAARELDRIAGEKFGDESPSLQPLLQTLDELYQVVTRIARDKGILVAAEEAREGAEGGAEGGGGASGDGALTAGGQVASREEALRRLAEVARFFRATEPHSPVAYLVDRAVKWGRMSLGDWLREVVKDEAQLGMLYDLLDARPPASE